MKNYFKNVLFVGPHYALRGGMASVLNVYSKTMVPFNFLPTYYYKNPILNILYFFTRSLKLAWILLTNRDIKIVHIHTASKGSFIRKSIILLISKLFRKKTVLHVHSGEFKIYFKNAGFLQSYIRYILNAADELVCLSDEWKTYFDSVTKQNSVVVNNPVIIPAEKPVKKVSLPVSVLFLNHVTVAKGLFDLTDFFAENKDLLKDSFKLTIAGAGDSERLLQFITANGLDDIIEFKGWVEGKQKQDLLESCDLFILPSYNEGLPVSILEAMACKKAIISTNVGGIPRIVKPGINGWLINPADKTSLANIFNEIKNNNTILEQYGERSFQIAQDYSPDKVNAELNTIYAGLLGVKPSTTGNYEYESTTQAETKSY